MARSIEREVEEILAIFGSQIVGETKIINDLDLKQKDFCTQTGLIATIGSALTNLTTKAVFALPSTFVDLIEVRYFDSTGNPLYDCDTNLKYKIEAGNIYFMGKYDQITSIPTSIASIYLVYHATPSALTTLTSSWTIPDQFVIGVTAMVYEEYYAKFPVDMYTPQGMVKARDTKMVQYWASVATRERIKAKKYVNSPDKSDHWNTVHPVGKVEPTKPVLQSP